MDKKILLNLIERIVSNEVKKQLPSLLQELLSTDNTELGEKSQETMLTEHKSTSLKHLLNSTEESTIQQPVQPPFKQYTKNTVLNQILNETKNDLALRESGRMPSVAVDGDFSMTKLDDGIIINEQITDSPSILDLKTKSPEVKSLFDRDFRSILKKSYKKKS